MFTIDVRRNEGVPDVPAITELVKPGTEKLNLLNLIMGVATDELPATTQSILLGGHLRVGFEDNIHYKRGQLAESNAQLVARAARIGRELGCEIASPDEARKMLSIPPLDLMKDRQKAQGG